MGKNTEMPKEAKPGVPELLEALKSTVEIIGHGAECALFSIAGTCNCELRQACEVIAKSDEGPG